MTSHDRPAPADHTELAVAWVLHTLDPEHEAEFLTHLELEGCVECAAVVADTSAALADVARAVPQEEPPPQLRERLLAAVEEESASTTPTAPTTPTEQPGTVTDLSSRRRIVRWAMTAAAAVAAVVVIGGLVVANQDLRKERDAQAAAAAQADRVVAVMRDAAAPGAVSAPLAQPGGELVGLVVGHGGRSDVVVTGLGANRPDQTYVLWMLDGRVPTAMGTFDVPSGAASVRSVPSDASAAAAVGFAVSLEPGRTAPRAPTQIVASGQVGR